jgi:hypothetical protein
LITDSFGVTVPPSGEFDHRDATRELEELLDSDDDLGSHHVPVVALISGVSGRPLSQRCSVWKVTPSRQTYTSTLLPEGKCQVPMNVALF